MQFIQTKDDLVQNILTVENYLHSKDSHEKEFAENLIRRGKTILVYKVNGENHFAPSRFLGYCNNSMQAHLSNYDKDGRETNPVIDQVLDTKPFITKTIETNFLQYVEKLGMTADNNKRRYWRLKDSKGKNYDILT